MIFLTGKENMDETIEIKVTSEMAGKRLDVVLSEQCSDLTRSYIMQERHGEIISVSEWEQKQFRNCFRQSILRKNM